MTGLVRAFTVCAALVLGLVSAQAADKAFKRDDLADAAIRLEAQIKTEAGIINKSAAALKSDTDAAIKRNDLRGAMQLAGQTVAVAPDDATQLAPARPRHRPEPSIGNPRAHCPL